MKEEKPEGKVEEKDNNAVGIWSRLTSENGVDKDMVDPLQILIEAGFEVEASSLRLSLQAKHTKSTEHVLTHEKELVDAKWVAIKKVEELLHKMFDELPVMASNAALVWLGYDYCRTRKIKPDEEHPEWILFYWDGEAEVFDPTPIDKINIKDRLIRSLDWCPARTFEAISFASMMYEVTFSQPSHYNSAKRLTGFMSSALISWRVTVTDNAALQKVIDWANRAYLKSSIGKKTQILALIISSLEFFFESPKFSKSKIEAIINFWQKIIVTDEQFLSKYETPYILSLAAKEVLGVTKLKGNIKIAEEIDRVTQFNYSDLVHRQSIYQKIDRYYTARLTAKESSTPLSSFTFSESELEVLERVCIDEDLFIGDAVSKCVEHAYDLSSKGKKYVMVETTPFLTQEKRGEKKTIRIRPKTVARLNSVIRNMNRHNLTGWKSFNKSNTLGLAIHLYASSLVPIPVSYKGDEICPVGMQNQQPRPKPADVRSKKRRPRGRGQSRATKSKGLVASANLNKSVAIKNDTVKSEATTKPHTVLHIQTQIEPAELHIENNLLAEAVSTEHSPKLQPVLESQAQVEPIEPHIGSNLQAESISTESAQDQALELISHTEHQIEPPHDKRPSTLLNVPRPGGGTTAIYVEIRKPRFVRLINSKTMTIKD